MAKVKLDDVAIEARETWKQSKTDVPVVGLEHLEPNEIWLKRWDLNPDENTFTKGFKKGQLLFGRRRAYQKKMSVASCDGICSGDITVILAKPEKILPELLPFYLRTDTFFDFAVRGSGGSLSPRVKWSHISDYEFDLPPMEEQKKLADLLWAANDLKESYKKAISATDEMLKAKFREMFGDGLSERVNYPHKKLSDVFDISSSRRILKSDWAMSGIPFLRVRDMVALANGEGLKNEYFVTEDFYNRLDDAEGKTVPGDILVSATSTIGKCYVVKSGERFYYKDADILRFRKKLEIDSKYFVFAMGMPTLRKQIDLSLGGTTVNHFLICKAQELQIPLPPLSLQREFVAIAEKADAAKSALKQSIADIDHVMKGLINQ